MTVPKGSLERRRVRTEVVTRVAVISVVAFLVVVGVLMVRLVVSIRHSSDVILDCTTVGGKCYQRGQDQTEKAIRTLELIVIASNTCSAQPGVTFHQVEACVERHLAKAQP